MAISNEIRRAGPYVGDGTQKVFSFAFKIFEAKDLAVYQSDDAGKDSLVNPALYSVSLNENQDNNPGGSITLLEPLAEGTNLTLISEMAYTQPMVLTNRGGFYPDILNNSADRSTIQIQQLKEKLDRTLIVPVTSAETPEEVMDNILNIAATANEYATKAENTYKEVLQTQTEIDQTKSDIEDLRDEIVPASELIQENIDGIHAVEEIVPHKQDVLEINAHIDEVHTVGQDLLGVNADYLSLGKVSEEIDPATMVVDGLICTVALSIENVNLTGQNIESVINVSENIDNLNVWLATFEGFKTDAEAARDAAQAQVPLATEQANLAKDWAVKLDATVDGSEYSSKYYAQQAGTQAAAASSSASAAATSAQASATSASESASSASSSANSATTATNQATEATTQAQAAQAAQTAAEAAQSKAETAAGNAETSATAAAESASTAATQATTATAQAELATSAKTASEAAQAKAETAQGAAETAASNAQASATAASGSASTASEQATAASKSASGAAGSALAASDSATAAQNAQTAAEAAQAAAEESARVAADIASGDIPVVRYDAQELTTEGQAQARANIDAAQSSHTHTVADLPVATTEQATAGTDTATVMTPATTKAAIEALSPPPDLSPYATTDAMNAALSTKANTSDLGALATLDIVGTDNIADGAVTAEKLAAGVVTADNLADTISLGTIS